LTAAYFGSGEMPVFRKIKHSVMRFYRIADAVGRSKAVETIEPEIEELENIFALLVLGAFIGIPSPPIHITMELMPDMEREFRIMIEKVITAHDPLGELFSVFGID
jgi:hypothetical protein